MYQASKYLPKFGKTVTQTISAQKEISHIRRENRLPSPQINVVVARRVHHKDYFMIPKILQGLYLIQNLDTNYLL